MPRQPTYPLELVRQTLASGIENLVIVNRRDGGMEYDRLGFSVDDVCMLIMGLRPSEFMGTSDSDSRPGAPTADWYLKPVRCPATGGVITIYIKFSIRGEAAPHQFP